MSMKKHLRLVGRSEVPRSTRMAAVEKLLDQSGDGSKMFLTYFELEMLDSMTEHAVAELASAGAVLPDPAALSLESVKAIREKVKTALEKIGDQHE